MRVFLDPGVTTGYALFDSQGNAKDYGQITGLDNLVTALTLMHRETPLEEIWHEPYSLRNDATRNMNKYQKKGHEDTLKVIGAIETLGKVLNISIQVIRYVSLDAAYAQAGIIKLPKSQHADSHQYDALAYGMAYYIWKRIKKVRRRPV